jgi:hypothetical protein
LLHNLFLWNAWQTFLTDSFMSFSQVLLALILTLHFASRTAAAPGDILFRHDFRGSAHGWTASSDYNPAVVTKFGLGMMGHGIEGSDTSAAPWFFQAPLEILGDRSAAYGGLLRLNYGHRYSAYAAAVPSHSQ